MKKHQPRVNRRSHPRPAAGLTADERRLVQAYRGIPGESEKALLLRIASPFVIATAARRAR